MNSYSQRSLKSFQALILFLISIGVLFLSFYKNQWGSADQAWFKNFQHDSESLILGRLVKSRQDGIFSSSGLPGSGDGLGEKGQYTAYLQRDEFESYEPYKSQIGLQGMAYSLLDRIFPFEPNQNLRLFYGMTALLLALIFSALILWFYHQSGPFTAGFVLISTLLSQWITVFGRNLWWSTWAFYLPLMICLYFLSQEQSSDHISDKLLASSVSAGILVKCFFNGYEYITTTLIMLSIPVVYFAILQRWAIWTLLKRLLCIQAGSLVSILISLVILSYQLSFIEGSYLAGVKHIIYVLGKRTYGDPTLYPDIYQKSLSADILSVISKYIHQTIIDFNNLFHTDQKWLKDAFNLELMDMVILFTLATILALALLRTREEFKIDKANLSALIGGTWFAILAPLSWFIVFKSHSYIHAHMNPITWHMPFTIFGFGLTGFVLTQLATILRKKSG